MTKAEFAKIAAALRTYFPRYNMLPNDEAMTLWYAALKDIPYQALSVALQKWVTTEKWPPSIADLRTACADVVGGDLPDWGEAWNDVTKAVHRYGWSRPQEALGSLPPLARQAAERIGWMQICESCNMDTLRAQFRQMYEIVAKRERTDRQLPEAIKQAASLIGNGAVKQLGEGSNT